MTIEEMEAQIKRLQQWRREDLNQIRYLKRKIREALEK